MRQAPLDLLQLQKGRKQLFNEYLLYSSMERILHCILGGVPEGVPFSLTAIPVQKRSDCHAPFTD